MSLPTKHVLGILVDNLLKRKSVLKLSSRTTTRWARGLKIPRGGKTILYTGHNNPLYRSYVSVNPCYFSFGRQNGVFRKLLDHKFLWSGTVH